MTVLVNIGVALVVVFVVAFTVGVTFVTWKLAALMIPLSLHIAFGDLGRARTVSAAQAAEDDDEIAARYYNGDLGRGDGRY